LIKIVIDIKIKISILLPMPKSNPKVKKATKAKKKPVKAALKKAAKKPAKPVKAKPKTKRGKTTKPLVKKAAPTATKKPAAAKRPLSSSRPSFKKEILKQLVTAKDKIVHEVSHKVKTESDVLKHEIGDIYDIASNERERELSLTFGDRDREKLSEIEDALERIKVGSYGACEECGEPIAEKRLKALPFTRVCVECQSKTEREQKIKGRFEEESGLGIMEKSEGEEEEF